MTANKLVIREYPYLLWLFGVGLLSIAGEALMKSTNLPALMVAVLGLLALVLPEALTISADRETGILSLRYGLFFNRSEKHIPIDQISTIRRVSTKMPGHREPKYPRLAYRVEIVQKDGQIIPFRSHFSRSNITSPGQVKELCSFLNVPDRIN